MMQRKRRMETSKDIFATFWNDKETGAEMCPAIVSGIVTEDAPVSYWPMLLAIITICTCAQLHSNTITGFACEASVSVQFPSRVKDRAKPPPPPPPILIFGSRSTFRAAKTENPVPWHSSVFFAPKPHGNACYAGYIRVCLLFEIHRFSLRVKVCHALILKRTTLAKSLLNFFTISLAVSSGLKSVYLYLQIQIGVIRQYSFHKREGCTF